MNGLTIHTGDARQILPTLPDASVHCCVTSPPYWGLRDYGTAKWEGGDAECEHSGEVYAAAAAAVGAKGDANKIEQQIAGKLGKWKSCPKCGARRIDNQIGLEKTPDDFVAEMVAVFREVRRVLRDDGTLWLNLGDSYYANGWECNRINNVGGNGSMPTEKRKSGKAGGITGLKTKDLVGIPWRVAFALQADGWWLRQDIIWHKPNPMPESVTDRCTKSHEYIFLLSKSQRYYFDQEAIREQAAESSVARLGQDVENQEGSDRVPGKTNGKMKAVKFGGNKASGYGTRIHSGKEWNPTQAGGAIGLENRKDGYITANKRSVWTVTTQPYKAAHFATFPPKLIEPCILAGCPEGGTVLDPFLGSGTTAEVARNLGRLCIGIELNPEYVKLAKKRNQQQVIGV